jgi:hypothetical protein
LIVSAFFFSAPVRETAPIASSLTNITLRNLLRMINQAEKNQKTGGERRNINKKIYIRKSSQEFENTITSSGRTFITSWTTELSNLI